MSDEMWCGNVKNNHVDFSVIVMCKYDLTNAWLYMIPRVEMSCILCVDE